MFQWSLLAAFTNYIRYEVFIGPFWLYRYAIFCLSFQPSVAYCQDRWRSSLINFSRSLMQLHVTLVTNTRKYDGGLRRLELHWLDISEWAYPVPYCSDGSSLFRNRLSVYLSELYLGGTQTIKISPPAISFLFRWWGRQPMVLSLVRAKCHSGTTHLTTCRPYLRNLSLSVNISKD